MKALGARILLIDDEPAIRRALRPPLLAVGFDLVESSCGEDALQKLQSGSFEVILLDINMPGLGGMETLRRIRSFALRLPILMLTVHDAEDEKIKAFDAGADGYVTKPFSTRELIARIRAAIRGSGPPIDADSPVEIGDLCLVPGRRSVTRGSQPIHLTRKEFEILHILMRNAGRTVPYSKLLSAVWGQSYCEEVEYLRTFVRILRKKISEDSSNPTYIFTEPSVGYRFVDNQMLSESPARQTESFEKKPFVKLLSDSMFAN
jgi:two-component system, OmpR family, KDP operon response regulator KdpE